MNLNAILNTDALEVRLKKVLLTVEGFLTDFGLDDSVIEKGKLLCPDLIDNAHKLGNKIDDEFQRFGKELQRKEIWDEFVITAILPYLNAWNGVVIAVKGKLNGAGDSR